DRNDALYDRATEALRRARMDEKVLPASAYAESMVLPNRLGPKAVAALDEALITLPVRIEPITATIAPRAAVLGARHASLPLAAASPFFRRLDLTREGLEWIEPPAALAHPLDDGTAVVLERSIDATAANLGPDAGAYRRLVAPLVPEWDDLAADALGPLIRI